jgi:hypothetical protein
MSSFLSIGSKSFRNRRKIADQKQSTNDKNNSSSSETTTNDDNNNSEISLETAVNTPISLINIKDTKYSKCLSPGDKNFTCNPADKKDIRGKFLKYSESRIIKRELEIYKLLDVGVPSENRDALDKDGFFHIKTPDTCNPSPYMSDDVKSNCISNNSTVTPVGLIMIMKDGGKDLEDYANKCIGISRDSVKNTDVQLEIKWFWIRAHDIIYGLYIFHKNGLMHYNIYPAHILFRYDGLKPDECKMYLIDYAKTRNRSDIIYFINQGESGFPENTDLSDYPFLQLYYYPPETFLLNADEFRAFSQLTTEDISVIIENLTEDIMVNAKYSPDKNSKNYYAKSFFDSFFPFMQYTMIGKNDLNNFTRYMNDFSDFLSTIAEEGKRDLKACYTKMLELNLKSFDSYGFGLSMLCVLKRSYHILDNNTVKTLNEFFYNLINPNVFKRNCNILSIMIEYEQILYQTGFLDSVKRYYDAHKLTIGSKVDNILLLPMNAPESIERNMPSKKPTTTMNGKPVGSVSGVPNERYTLIFNYLKYIIPIIIQYYSARSPGQPTEQQLINYIASKYTKIRIQTDIMTSNSDVFVSVLGRDPELAKQYELLTVDLQQIEKTINTR